MVASTTQIFDQIGRSNAAADNVIANMDGGVGHRFTVVEQVVEGRHAIGISW
jgi:hypothetical protein|tara:strand:- start:3328 stop:3483 length:156 start_codon:yes stop_codon:yes gene_type:complete